MATDQPTTVAVHVPSNHRQAERRLIALVHAGVYEIDSHGQVWKIARQVRNRWDLASIRYVPYPRRRAEKRMRSGYLLLSASISSAMVIGLAHRLVWQYFRGDIPDGLVINHRNGLKDDNRPDNLEVVTPSGNTKHAYRAGLMDEHGERNPAAKLTDNQVGQIRQAYAEGGYTMQALADRFGVRCQHVSRLIRGERRPKQEGPIARQNLRRNPSEKDPVTGQFIGPVARSRRQVPPAEPRP